MTVTILNALFKYLLLGALTLGIVTLFVHSEIIHEQQTDPRDHNGDADIPEILIERVTLMKTMNDSCPGPFTECVGKSGSECCDLIAEACDREILDCITRAPGQMMLRNFNPSRVYVSMDENGMVQKAPSRG